MNNSVVTFLVFLGTVGIDLLEQTLSVGFLACGVKALDRQKEGSALRSCCYSQAKKCHVHGGVVEMNVTIEHLRKAGIIISVTFPNAPTSSLSSSV